MIDQKVVVLATGGTIAMKYDPKLKGLVPACTGEDLAAAVPGLGEVAPFRIYSVFQHCLSGHDASDNVGSARQT